MSLPAIRMFPVAMLAAALAATLALTAAPAVAQTTVTSNGRDGPTACLSGQSEVTANNLPITALSTSSVTFTRPEVRWNQYVPRLGDVITPDSATMYSTVFNARTGVKVAGISGPLSADQSQISASQSVSSLAAKTNYYIEVFVESGSIPKQVFARRCFMTGGTYTIPANPIASGPTQGSTGCFAISPLTLQDVRNCWCGRKTTLTLFSDPQENTNFLNMWGCK